MIEQLADLLPLILSWKIWFLTALAVLLGLFLGALPGVGPAVAVAILASLTFGWSAADALVFLGVLYPACTYGGSISAILFNVPGHGGSAATVLDGFPMCEKGQGATALGFSVTASFMGGLVGSCALILFSPVLAQFGLRFGPAENFILAILGLSIISVVIRTSTVKGLVCASLGLLLSTAGYDVITGHIRYDFGTLYLQDGIPFVQALIGLFAISQVISLSLSGQSISRHAELKGNTVQGFIETFRYPFTLIRSSVIGTVVGALPGAGMVTASFLSYAETVRASKDPDSFGKGNSEGVIAAEAANNSAIMAELIPTITLGIPGGAGVAVFLGVMIMHGITPGPLAFVQSQQAISALFLGLLLSNFFILMCGMSIARYFAHATLTPNYVIVPSILILSLFGSYGLRNSIQDVLLTVFFGFLGYALKKTGFPVVPLILGLILGPIAERGLQQALMISGGQVGIFFASPTARVMWLLLLIALTAPLYGPVVRHYWKSRAGGH
jgi:putative tricarboxylic transport membrane protein